MKKILCIVLTLLFCLSSILTVSAEEVKWLAKPQFENIYGCDDDGNIILAKMNEKYGYIDKNGKIIIDFIYDYATCFSEGMAYVKKDEVYSYIDKSGKTLFILNLMDYLKNLESPNMVDKDDYVLRGTRFSGDYAIVAIESSREPFIIDKAGKYVSMPDGLSFHGRDASRNIADIYNNIAIVSKKTEGVGYLDIIDGETKCVGYLNIKTGKTVFSNYRVNDFKDGYGILNYGDGTIAVVNENLDFVNKKINIGAASASISNGIIYLEEYTKDGEPLNGSYIDMNGKTIIPKNYISLGEYKDGLISATIEENGVTKVGYIDINGKWVIKPIKAYSYTEFFRGLAAFSETKDTYNKNYVIIDKTGKYVLQPQFEDFLYDNYNAYAMVDGLWGILDLDVLTTTNVPNDIPGKWYIDEVTKAINNKLVPSALQNKYAENITRKDFCDLAISLIESKTGKNINEIISYKGLSIAENIFVDTSDKNVLAANALSIVQGKDRDKGIFDPNGYITRQDAAIMLTNTAEALGVNVSSKEAVFPDSDSIGSWAKAAVNYVSSNKIMNGTNKGFEARANYTRQQAYVTIFRLFEAIK